MTKSTCLAMVGCALLWGCSLTSLGEFDIPQCTDNAQCDPLNELHGLSRDVDCETYQCRPDKDGCELRVTDFDDDGALSPACDKTAGSAMDCDDEDDTRYPDAEETCDGVDNNCNLIIDEGTAPAGAQQKLKVSNHAGDRVYFGDAQGLSLEDENAPHSVFLRSTSQGEAVSAMLDVSSKVDVLNFGYQLDAKNADLVEDADGGNCATVGGSSAECVFNDVAGTFVDGQWMVAAISSTGCSDGQLRVGYRTEDVVGLRGPETYSNITYGVDVGDGRCTGASRESAVMGATQLAIAGQAGDIPQALLGFIADGLQRDACGGTKRDVEVMGIWLESLATGISWTNATNNGAPQVLGATKGGGRPVVQSMTLTGPPLGYIVAYGAAAGGLALHRLPLFEDPPAFDSNATQSRPTDPIRLGAETRLFEDRTVDHVALTQVGVVDDYVSLGLAWVEGCGSQDASIAFARARYYWSDQRFEADDPIDLATASGLSTPPAVLHLDAGFVEAGYQRGKQTASADEQGGFFVAWANGKRVEAARVLDLDGEALDEPFVQLQVSDTSAETPGVMAYYAGTQASFVSYEATGLWGGALRCEKLIEDSNKGMN